MRSAVERLQHAAATPGCYIGPMDSQELSEKLLGLIHTMATAALAVPREDREAWLVRNRQECFDEAIRNRIGVAEATGWADQVDSWVRALIRIIENSGGTSGGSA